MIAELSISYTENLTRKVDLWPFFHEWNRWKNTQINFPGAERTSKIPKTRDLIRVFVHRVKKYIYNINI